MNYNFEAWKGFEGGTWQKEINVRSFIKHNYTPYDGDESFLVGPTQNTKDLWEQVLELTRQERAAGGKRPAPPVRLPPDKPAHAPPQAPHAELTA